MDDDSFWKIHELQLESIPKSLHLRLRNKLVNSDFDAGNFFQICEDSTGTCRWIQTKSTVKLEQEGDIFLIDHAWTFDNDGTKIKEALLANKALSERLEQMFCLSDSIEITATQTSSSVKHKQKTTVEPDPQMVETLLAAMDHSVSVEQAKEALSTHNNELINALSALRMLQPDNEHSKALEQMNGSLSELQQSLGSQVQPRATQKTYVLTDQDRLNRLFAHLWRYSLSYYYTSKSSDDKATDVKQVWYVMDEVGSAIQHSLSAPNVAVVPFLYHDGRGLQGFSVMWPVTAINGNCTLERNWVPAVYASTPLQADAYSYLLLGSDSAKGVLVDTAKKELGKPFRAIDRPNSKPATAVGPVLDRILVFSDMSIVRDSLPSDMLTDDISQATMCWLYKDLKLYDCSFAETVVSQFLHETSIVQKHNLARLVHSYYGLDGCKWFPLSFILQNDFAKGSKEQDYEGVVGFASASAVKSRYWICKPANLARGLGIFVSPNTARILKQSEMHPALVQEYLDSPMMYNNLKFDLRFILLVTSLDPLQVFVFDKFWIRLANEKYVALGLGNEKFPADIEQDNEMHFTVMNYKAGARFQQVKCDEFIESVGAQKWAAYEGKIYKAFLELFQLASQTPAPLGIHGSASERAFALYGVDVMLDSSGNPYILEVNFNPDCTRAVKFYPDFTEQVIYRVAKDMGFNCKDECFRSFKSLV